MVVVVVVVVVLIYFPCTYLPCAIILFMPSVLFFFAFFFFFSFPPILSQSALLCNSTLVTAPTDAVRITSGLVDRSATGVVWLVAWFLAGWLFTLLSRLLSPSVSLLLIACLLGSLLLLADIKHVVNNTGETEEQGYWYDNIGHFYGAWSPAKSDNQYDTGRSFLPCCCCCCCNCCCCCCCFACPVLTRAL